MKQSIQDLLKKMLLTFVFFAVFVCLLSAFRVWDLGPILSQGTILIVVLLFIFLTIYWVRAVRKKQDASSNALVSGTLAIALGAAISYSFLISLPALVDRSLTVYLLSTISQSESGISPVDLQTVASEGWWPSVDQVGNRIEEQASLGTISSNESGLLEITQRGEATVWVFRAVQTIFRLEPKIVNGYQSSN